MTPPMSEVERSLAAAVERQRDAGLDLLRDLVNCDSGTFNKDETDRAGAMLAAVIGRLGFATERIPQERYGDHVVARRAARGDRRLLFVGHFDTVFPRGTVATRPFSITGDRATGPGVYDMKSGLVVLVTALTALREISAPVWDDVSMTVIFNSDEEVLSPTSRPIIEAEARRADTVCILEPARPGGEYTFVRKGAAIYTLAVSGRAAHSGGQPELGRSAIEELAQKIVRLHQITNYQTGTTVNVGIVRGGERANVVADHAECDFDLRVLTPAEAEAAQRRIRDIAAMQFVPDTTSVLSGEMAFPPLPPRATNELLFSWVREEGQKLGLDLRSVVSGGGSDGNTTGQFAPTIDGMGARGDGAHSDREFIHVSSIVERAQVLSLFLNTWPSRADELNGR